jgi:hypothetical protein
MKYVKKALIVSLLLCMGMVSLFADSPIETTGVGPGVDASDATYEALGVGFSPISVRAMGMGGAGIAVAGRSDSFFLNPAALAAKRFQLSLPSIGVTVYNPQQILESGIIGEVQAASDDDSKMISAAQKYVKILGKGYNETVTTDAGFSIAFGGFGLGVQAQEKIHSYNKDGMTTSSKLIAEMNAAATLGYGFRINIIEDSLSIDLGVAARFNYKAYSSAITVDTLTTTFLGDESGGNDAKMNLFLNTTPMMAGWAVPIDVGLSFNMPVGFTLSSVVRNLNGKYHMTAYPGISNWAEELFGDPLTTDKTTNTTMSNSSFEFTIPWSLDIGLGWAPSFGSVDKLIRPTVAVDVVDLVDLFEEEITTERLLTHLKAGAEVKLFSMLDVRAGLNQGYITVGAGLDLFIIRLDAAYYRQEFGVQLGDKPVDALTIRANIGFDR